LLYTVTLASIGYRASSLRSVGSCSIGFYPGNG
jgi:hypothetical protein